MQSSTHKFSRLITCTALAGLLSWLFFEVIASFDWSQIYSSTVPVMLAVALTFIVNFGWKKSIHDLETTDFIRSLAVGMASGIGVITAVLSN